jgi:hypothetical protein
MMFSNGLRFVDPAFARGVLEAGVTRIAIALWGASAERHDAVTGVAGSFERTLAALNTLGTLRRQDPFVVEVRLLVSRQTASENERIVRLIHDRTSGVDEFSLNRLILSEHARAADSTVSWEEASGSIDQTMSLVRTLGYRVSFEALPLCVFRGENATFVRGRILEKARLIARGLAPRSWTLRYFDPLVAAGRAATGNAKAALALPAPCLSCDYLSACGRVEGWYTQRYGASGLQSIRLATAESAPP